MARNWKLRDGKSGSSRAAREEEIYGVVGDDEEERGPLGDVDGQKSGSLREWRESSKS